MLLRIFKTSQPLSWLLIVIFTIALRLILFLTFYIEPQAVIYDSFTSNFLFEFAHNSPYISHFSATLIVIFSGFYFNQIAQNITIVKGIHYIILLFTGIFMSFQPANLVVTPMIWAVPILLYSFSLILNQSKGDISLVPVFNAAFFVGLATLIYLPSSILLVILFFALTYLNKVTWRHYVVAIIGIGTTWLFHDIIAYSLGNLDWMKINYWPNLISRFNYHNYAPLYSTGIIIGLIILQSAIYFKTSSRSIMRIHKALTLNYWYLALTAISTGFFVDAANDVIGLTIIPISILFSVFHLEVKKWWMSDLTFIILILAMALSYLGI